MRNRIFGASLLLLLAVASVRAQTTGERYEESSQYPNHPESLSILDSEKAAYKSVQLSYDHMQTFSFQISHVEDYIVGVDVNQTIKGNIKIYFEQDNTFYESTDIPGEETRMMIYQDRRNIIYNDIFFNCNGFSFQASKGHEYVIRLIKSGKDKLAIINMENYLTQGETAWNLGSEHVGLHQEKTLKIREELKGILGIVERNAVINEQIANHVQQSTERYMFYQLLETALVVFASVGQVRLIKRLLSDNSII